MELIEGERAAMFPMGAWWMQQAARPNPTPLSVGLSGYAPMPFPDVTGKGAPDDLLGGIDVMIGITKSAKDPEAACKVLTDWVAGAAAQVLIDSFNDLPAVKGITPVKFETDNQRQVWETLTGWLEKVKYARQLRSPAVKQAFEDNLAAVAAGEVTPEAAMANVQAAWETTKAK
jgi:raffinose/stachyose/melibiose transport system substrate-binding protein